MLARIGPTAVLAQRIGAAALALTPPEAQQAVQWLTAPQAALLRTAREVTRDITLGR